MNSSAGGDGRRIGEFQQRQQREEFRAALRALLMQPLMNPAHDMFPAVRRQSTLLSDWFTRETGWTLLVARDGARLYKRPADLTDATRGLPHYDRRCYVLLCLACAVLERSDSQITLCVLGDRLMQMVTEPVLHARRFSFTLNSLQERRELVTVCRTLLALGVLRRVAGDEEAFVQRQGDADALYDVHRRTLAGMLAAARGPSTWSPETVPSTIDERLRALVTEHIPDSDEGRRMALRHALARRLLDDPVVYADTLDADSRAYFFNQRGAMAARLCEATGLTAEQRAEGLALTDETGTLTDISMPAEGTDAHVTLLVAEYLARQTFEAETITEADIATFVRDATARYGRYWRKSAREPGAERELVQIALDRLQKLRLIVRAPQRILPLPAIARFALGETEVQSAARIRPSTESLFR
jgi:uncharacterized protein (TIGR02678 family)